MWEDVGVIRDGAGLTRAWTVWMLEAELLATGLPDMDLAYNLTWHDWLNLRSLIEIGRVIAQALKRENPAAPTIARAFDEGDLETSYFTLAQQVKAA